MYEQIHKAHHKFYIQTKRQFSSRGIISVNKSIYHMLKSLTYPYFTRCKDNYRDTIVKGYISYVNGFNGYIICDSIDMVREIHNLAYWSFLNNNLHSLQIQFQTYNYYGFLLVVQMKYGIEEYLHRLHILKHEASYWSILQYAKNILHPKLYDQILILFDLITSYDT